MNIAMAHPILFVDDQEDILRILEREFIRTGDYDVYAATNPAEAWEILRSTKVELIIADVRLGEDNGFQLLRDLREEFPGLGMMMMTAYRSPGYRHQADALGVAFFIEKPFAVNTLVRSVERFFLTREAPRPPAATTAGPAKATANALSHFKVQDMVQLFCLNGRSMIIELTLPGIPERGIIVIHEGKVWHAELGTMIGEPAFFRILSVNNAECELDEIGERIFPQSVQASWEFLLLESARMADEIEGYVDNEPIMQPSDFDAATALEAHAERTSETVEAEVNGAERPPSQNPDDPFADFWKTARLPGGGKLKLS